MWEILTSSTFWAAISSFAASCAAALAYWAVRVARSQLRELARTAGNDALIGLYRILDDPRKRLDRRRIWKEMSNKDSKDLTDDQWTILETIATDMDVVGTMLKYDLVKHELILERYTEVIIPLWETMSSHVIFRRLQKGGFGWQNFEWLAKRARRWSESVRGTGLYSRF